MSFALPPLPFPTSALASRGMCQETLELHHGKHHKTYVETLNKLVEKDETLKGKSLEELIVLSHGNERLQKVFNNAGQHWNHMAFWESLSPDGGGVPGGLEKKLKEDFGSVEQFKTEFKTAAVEQFASGWAWLVLAKGGRLKIVKTPNAVSPLATGEGKVLLVLDVWEHAYYVDFRNRRPDFTENFLARLANFENAEVKLRAA